MCILSTCIVQIRVMIALFYHIFVGTAAQPLALYSKISASLVFNLLPCTFAPCVHRAPCVSKVPED